MMIGRLPKDHEWLGITQHLNDFDSFFVYGNKQNMICCKPSCKVAKPLREHLRIYSYMELALQDGFIPCKKCKPGNINITDAQWLSQINQYIEQHYTKKITLEHIARALHSSPFHLQRMYKKLTGKSPNDYIQWLRKEQAKKLLQTTSLSMKEISVQIGFQNKDHFSVFFKKHVGITPLKFRKGHRDALHDD